MALDEEEIRGSTIIGGSLIERKDRKKSFKLSTVEKD